MATLTNGKITIDIVNVTEGENDDVNITQYTVENGASLSDHVQQSGKGVAIDGFLFGESAENDYKTILNWQNGGVEVTYKGRTYHTKILLGGLRKNYDNYSNGFSISFNLVVVQKAKTSWKKKSKGKQQATKKSEEVYVTVKSGDTYWGWWRKYGTAIQTLRNWNKWPDRFIPIGKRARVK